MTLLAFMPCGDKKDNAVFEKYHTTIQKDHSCNNLPDQETCPPFCTCSCCSTVRALQSQMVLEFTIAQVFRIYATQPTPAVQQMSVSIWQPPQLS